MNKLSLYTAVLCCLAAPIPCAAYANPGEPADVQQAEQTELRDLHEAIRKGDDAAAIQIIRRCTDPNVRFDGHFAIELAAEFGRVEVIRELQAHPSYSTSGSAFWLALDNGHWEAAKLLYDPTWRNPKTGGASTQLIEAIEEGDEEFVLWLIDNTDPILEPNEALRSAVKRNSGPILTRLLEKGVNPNECDGYDGTTALHLAVIWDASTELVRILLEFGADPDIKPPKKRRDRKTLRDDETPYKAALRYGCKEAAEMMRAASKEHRQKR